MAEMTVLEFGPFVRAVSSVEGHNAPPETMVEGLNMLVDPVAGGAFKRSGLAIVGDSVTGATKRASAGLLESAPEYVPRRLRQFYSDALADGLSGGYPTHSVLFTKEASSTNWPNVDDGVFGTEYVRRPNANYVLMSEFGSTAYPTGGGSHGGVAIKYLVEPWWYESGEGGYSRGAFEFARRFALSGAWDSIDAGRWRYYGGLRGTPVMWDGGCNDSSASISNAIRVRPTGPFSPLWHPVATATDAIAEGSATAEYPWASGDCFYMGVIFQFEDGSYSLPTQPRAVNAILTSGLGFVTVDTPTGTNVYKSIVYTNIPKGPAGTTARLLARCPKQNRTAATTLLTLDISDLRIFGVLRNNTQTSYTDTLGDDDGLLQDTDVVRWDLICPLRSRHLGTGDQRVIAGYTLPSQCAIQLTCAQIGATGYDQNVEDDNTTATGATSAVYRVTTTGIELAVATAAATLAITQVLWATAGNETIQGVVDRINMTARDATHGMWKAMLAPGVDGSAASSGLCPTVWTAVSATSTASAVLTIDAATLALIPIGYKIFDATGTITAGTYVLNKLTSTTLTMSAAAAGAGAGAGLIFYADCGDTACTSSEASSANRFGWIRTHGSSYRGHVYFKRSALPGYARPSKDRIYFTISSPGAAATGVSIAANAWGAANRRDGVNQPGQIMGIVDVEGAAVICYRNRIGLFVNERGANTGEDFDLRIKTINGQQGCVSPWGVVSAAGCAVYPTAVGIKATDKSRREVLLSGDIYQPVRSKGDLAYEVPLCVAAAGSDSPDCWLSGAAWGNRLVYSYRRSASAYGFSVYDFSLGADQLGLDALANPEERKPYGWSTVCLIDQNNDIFGPRAMGAVQRSAGLLFYGAINDNGGTADGRVDQMFTGANDNGVAITGAFVTRRVVADPGTRIVAQGVTSLHRTSYAGPSIGLVRTDDGAEETNVDVTSSGSNELTTERLQWEQKGRSPAKVLQLSWYDAAASTGGLVWRLSQPVEVLRSVGG